MRRAVFALTAILVTIFLIEPIAQVSVVNANFLPPWVPQISGRSPNSTPYIYTKPTVDISFDYHIPNNMTQVDSFSYSLDGNPNSMLPSSKAPNVYYGIINYTVFKTLENIANGNHTLTIYAHFVNGTLKSIWETKITIDTTYVEPTPIMISPLNQTTYYTNQIPLIYSINKTIIASWYVLDTSNDEPNNNWKSFSNNTTLPYLSEGQHSIRIAVITDAWQLPIYKELAQTIYFNINTSSPTPTVPELSWLAIIPLIISILSVAIAFRRRKNT